MGSRSTFLPGAFGGYLGRPLRSGDALAIGEGFGEMHLLRASAPSRDAGDTPLRVVAGPQARQFGNDGLAAFFGGRFRVTAASDRRGLRLTGPVVTHAAAELLSQGVLPGAVQVPPDGQPIILGWDGPVTGGYPVIAAVISADLPRMAQLRPGDSLGFSTIEIEVARSLASPRWRIEELA
jgi:allophanate hydrolase subunit 2